jgi:chemotaxis protein MotB
MTITPEGLRIELIEGKEGTFYEIGSPKLNANGQELLTLLAAELKTLPNSLLIEGHTDSTPYTSDSNTGYSNWDLSADRANSARRLLQQAGVRSNQVSQVRGYADQMLRVKSNPTDPSNRRISILVKNDNETVPTLSAANVVNGTTPLPGAAKGPAQAGNRTKSQNVQPAATPAAPAAAPVSSAVKPPASKQAAKLGLMANLKNLLPGARK